VSVLSLSADGEDGADSVNGVPVRRLGTRNLYVPFQGQHHGAVRAVWHLLDSYNPLMAAKVGAILDAERPDWLCASNLAGFSVAVWAEAKKRGIQVLQILHDYYMLCPRSTMHSGSGNCASPCGSCRVYGAPRKWASGAPDLVIGVSRFVLERHLAAGYFPRAQHGVVFNGAPYEPGYAQPQRAGEPLQLGFIGRVEAVKGIETLLRALSRLPTDAYRLRVAGRATDPAYLDYLKQTYPLPGVEYLGYVRARDLYESVQLVVVPSEWNEPLPGVVYEPLGFGVPVLASRIGGIPEILGDAGCGWLFEPGNVDDLTRVLGGLLAGWPDAAGMAERARARRRLFVPDRAADELLALMDRCGASAR